MVELCWEKPGRTVIVDELSHNLMRMNVKVTNFTGYENFIISYSKTCKASITELIIKEKWFKMF